MGLALYTWHSTMYIRPHHFSLIILPIFWLSLILFTLKILAPAQAKNNQKLNSTSESGEPFTFKVPVNAVLVKVRVTDKRGVEIKDLTVDDFKLYEDGKLQRIQSFELESTQPVVSTELASQTNGQEKAETPRMQNPESSTNERTRLISCFIDDLTAVSVRNHYWVISALQRFVEEEMGPHDQVGIFSASGGVRIPFTSDKAVLQNQIKDLNMAKLDLFRTYRSKCPVMTDQQALRIIEAQGGMSFTRAIMEASRCLGLADDLNLGQNNNDLVEQHVRSEAFQQHQGAQSAIQRLVAGLRQHLRYLQHFKASKSMVLFSDGFVPGRSTRWRLDRVIDRALVSRVVFNVVDTRGLYTVGFNANSNEQARNVNPFGLSQEAFAAGLAFGQELSGMYSTQVEQSRPLEKLAADTGGIYFRDNNDLVAGLRQIRNSHYFYYMLSYASPNQKANGRYHKIKVEVNRPGVEFSHRRGYFASREEISFEDRKNEDIQLALEAPGDFDQIPVQLSYNYVRVEENLYRLSLFTKVSINGVNFLQKEGRHKNLFHLIIMVYDANDKYVEGSEKEVELNLSDSSYLTMLQHGFTSKMEVEVQGGSYKVRSVVRESNQTKMGAIQHTVKLLSPVADGENNQNQIGSIEQSVVPRILEDNRARPLEELGGSSSFSLASLESSNLVVSQETTQLANLDTEQQRSLLGNSDALIFKDVHIHHPLNDRIHREFPVTFFYKLFNLRYSEQKTGLTAKVQLIDEWGKIYRFRPISLGESKTHFLGGGEVSVAFNLSFKNMEPGEYKLTLMTTAPEAKGQSVGSKTTVKIEP